MGVKQGQTLVVDSGGGGIDLVEFPNFGSAKSDFTRMPDMMQGRGFLSR
jgi:hypothetical protein